MRHDMGGEHASDRSLGTCRECGETVTRGYSILEYEADGETAVLAECPDCRAVVKFRGVAGDRVGYSSR